MRAIIVPVTYPPRRLLWAALAALACYHREVPAGRLQQGSRWGGDTVTGTARRGMDHPARYPGGHAGRKTDVSWTALAHHPVRGHARRPGPGSARLDRSAARRAPPAHAGPRLSVVVGAVPAWLSRRSGGARGVERAP